MPPIATSTSCSTLVDLNTDDKSFYPPLTTSGYEHAAAAVEVARTNILLPSDEYDECQQYLHVPILSSQPLVSADEYLGTVPSIAARCDELLAVPPRVYTAASPEAVLNVCQGEIAHVLPSQRCDVVMSTDATTCHIVAVRSSIAGAAVCKDAEAADALTSLAHIDGTGYEACLEEMIETHKRHHGLIPPTLGEEEKKEEGSIFCSFNDPLVDVDVHIVGGFNDDDGCSREITSFLLNFFSRVAARDADALRFTLRTCAVSSMNDTGFAAPIGRGMGVDVRTGEAFLADVGDDAVAGPAMELRSCRLWAGNSDGLSVVQAPRDDTIVVHPFEYKPFRDINKLLALPDDVLLQCSSTSPDCEADHFCDNLRRTLHFMKTVSCTESFGPWCDEAIVYRRSTRRGVNAWVKVGLKRTC